MHTLIASCAFGVTKDLNEEEAGDIILNETFMEWPLRSH
jgi:hypothetical protein